MNESVFKKAYQQFAKGIFRYLYIKVSDADIASDLAADTFIRFWKVLQREEVKNTKALLFSIATGIVIDYYRKKKKEKKISIEEIDESLLGYTDLTAENLAKKQEIEAVFRKVKKLKKDYQDIVVFYYVEELTIEEISLIFNKTENNTRVLLHRAVQALKKLL